MHPLRRYAPLLGLVAVAACAPGEARVPEPVYRYINVGDGSRIRLGETFRRQDLADRIDDTTYALRPGTFDGGGTETITAHMDARGVLRGLTFVYDGSEPLATKIRNYTASLGAPTEVQAHGDSSSVHVWQDAETRFELHFLQANAPRFWSRLIDRTGAAPGDG